MALPSVAAADNVLVRPWGENTLRAGRAELLTLTDELPTAYLPGGRIDGFGSALLKVEAGPVSSGNIKAEVAADGMLSFTRVSDSKVLFKETAARSRHRQRRRVECDLRLHRDSDEALRHGTKPPGPEWPWYGCERRWSSYDFQKSIS